MNTWIRCLLLLLFLVPVQQSAYSQIGLIQPDQANDLLNSSQPPVVLDTRGGYKDYFRGHLPRAHHLNFDTLRGTDNGVPVQYLPDELTIRLLQRAGVNRHRTHLIYATGAQLPNDEILSASMVAYVLEKFGVEDIRILNGGLARWKTEGLPVVQEYFGNPPGELPETMRPEIGIDLNELLDIKDQEGVILLDARPRNEYEGKDDIWLRKGHIPGAINFHWAKLMADDNTHQFLPLEENLKKLTAAGVAPNKQIVVYCGTSREGSLLRFYLAHVAKFPEVRLYEGSWKEYASLPEHPAATGPTPSGK